jgi:hypothetical protein
MLAGMTTQSALDLLPLAKSWLHAPPLALAGSGFTSQGYDPSQRAYLLTRDAPTAPAILQMTLQASNDSPLQNPAFVIKQWGDDAPTIKINGQSQTRGPAFRYGIVSRLEGDDLVIWLRMTAVTPVRISVE